MAALWAGGIPDEAVHTVTLTGDAPAPDNASRTTEPSLSQLVSYEGSQPHECQPESGVGPIPPGLAFVRGQQDRCVASERDPEIPRKAMHRRSRLLKLSAMLLATVHLAGAELGGTTHGVCAYHGDGAEHHEQGSEPTGHVLPAGHSDASEHEGASGTSEFHCTASCCCSVVAAPPALGSLGLLQSTVDGPHRNSNLRAGRQAIPYEPHILPFANAPPVSC